MDIIKCNRCGKTGDSSLFSKSNVSKDGSRALCKECKGVADSLYRKKNKEKVAEYFKKRWRSDPESKAKNKVYKEKLRSGMNATEYVKDKCCKVCKMTNDQHLDMYGERLHIHHNNNKGRYNIRHNIPPDHSCIMVLCRSCHVSIDNKNRDYTGRGKRAWEARRRNEENRNKV